MNEIVVRASRYRFAETVDGLKRAISGVGATLFAEIDQAAAAASAGLSLRPTTLLVFGNPKAGTVLMDAFPLVALALPLKIVVWETDGTVSIAYEPASVIAARYDSTGKEPIVAAMDIALATIIASVS